MPARSMPSFGALSLVLSFLAGPALATDDLVVRTELPLKTPRSREPVLGGAREKIFVQESGKGVRTSRLHSIVVTE